MVDELLLTDGQRLLRRILECPEDDACRLIYSDWLEEHGRELAARFIRSQICQGTPRTVPLSYIDQIIERIMGVQPHQMSNSGCKVDAIVAATGQSTTLAIYRRGFVKEIRLTCEAFVGGPCPKCSGSGMSEREYHGVVDDDGGCGRCGGTGRIEGVARELFERHPLTRIVLIDKTPNPPGRAIGWIDFGDGPDVIPSDIFEHIDGEYLPGEYIWKRYLTESDALTALSRACVAYGRSLVGLPMLDSK